MCIVDFIYIFEFELQQFQFNVGKRRVFNLFGSPGTGSPRSAMYASAMERWKLLFLLTCVLAGVGGHVLHAQCLLSLVSSGMTALRKCPLCRMAISAVLPIFLDFSNSEAAPSVEDDGGGGSKDICRLHQLFGDLLLLGKVARPAELNEMVWQ